MPVISVPASTNVDLSNLSYLPDINVAEFMKQEGNDTKGMLAAIKFVEDNFPTSNHSTRPRLFLPRRNAPYVLTSQINLTVGMSLVGDTSGNYSGSFNGTDAKGMPVIQFKLNKPATDLNEIVLDKEGKKNIGNAYINLIDGACLSGIIFDCSEDLKGNTYEESQRAVIRLRHTAVGTHISNIKILSPFVGIHTDEIEPTNFGRCTFENIFLHNVRHTGMRLGHGESAAWDFVVMKNIEVWNSWPCTEKDEKGTCHSKDNYSSYGRGKTSIGIDIGKIDGLMMSSCGMFGCEVGLRFRYNQRFPKSDYSTIANVVNCMFDACGTGVHIAGSNKISITGGAWNMADHCAVKVNRNYDNYDAMGNVIQPPETAMIANNMYPTVILSGLDLLANSASPVQADEMNELIVSGCNFTTKSSSAITANNVSLLSVTGCTARIYRPWCGAGEKISFVKATETTVNGNVNDNNIMRCISEINLKKVVEAAPTSSLPGYRHLEGRTMSTPNRFFTQTPPQRKFATKIPMLPATQSSHRTLAKSRMFAPFQQQTMTMIVSVARRILR